jgi:hypothetical protein
VQGTLGAQGITGSQGTQGTQGIQGIQGISGASILGLNNTFTGTNAFTSATFNASTSTVTLKQNSSGSYAGLRIYNDQDSAYRALEIDYSGSSYSGSLITGGPAGESAAITTTGAYPLVLATSNTARLIISSSGSVGIGTTSPVVKLDIIGTTSGSLRMADNATDATNKVGRIVGRQSTNADTDFLAFDIRGLTTSNEINYGGGSGILNSATSHTFYTAANKTTLTGTVRMIIDSSGNVGIGTTSPGKLLEVNKNLATNTVGSGEVLRLIGDDGNNVSRVTEIGFGTGPTGGVYSPVLIGAVVTSASGYNTKDLYFATRSGTADSVATERMRITSTGNVSTSAGSAISYGAGETYIAWTDEPEYSIADSSADSNYKTMKTFVASKSGSFKFKFSGYIQSGSYYWAWRLLQNSVTVASSGNYGSGLDTGQVAEVHAYRRFAGTVSSVTPGDIFELQMVSSDGSGNPSTGNGQLLYAKEFRIYSTTPSLDHGGSTNVFGNQVGIGTTTPTTGFGGTIANVKLALKNGAAGSENGTSVILIGGDNSHYASITAEHIGGGRTYLAIGTSGGAVNPAERARFDDLGNLLVGQTTSGGNKAAGGICLRQPEYTAGGSSILISHATSTTNGNSYAEFSYGGSSIGNIVQSGTTAVIYNTSSDYRLKDIIGPVINSGTFIDALKPKVGSWKSDGSKFVGFLAHEFAEVSPSSVSGEKDAVDSDGKPVYQAMQASSSEVIANLVAELQSLRARLAALESK